MDTEKLVLAALKEKSPQLHRQLEQAGKLQEYVTELAAAITDQRITLGMEIAFKHGYGEAQKTDMLKAVGIRNMANSMATEIVLKEMLEFPQDDPETVGETKAGTAEGGADEQGPSFAPFLVR